MNLFCNLIQVLQVLLLPQYHFTQILEVIVEDFFSYLFTAINLTATLTLSYNFSLVIIPI